MCLFVSVFSCVSECVPMSVIVIAVVRRGIVGCTTMLMCGVRARRYRCLEGGVELNPFFFFLSVAYLVLFA